MNLRWLQTAWTDAVHGGFKVKSSKQLKLVWFERMTLKSTNCLQLHSRNMLNSIINVSEENMAFGNATKEFPPCHKASPSSPRILPLPLWTSIGSVQLSFCFLHPPAYPDSFYWASTEYNPGKGTNLHRGKAGSSYTNFTTSRLQHGTASRWTRSSALGGDNLTLISTNCTHFWFENI